MTEERNLSAADSPWITYQVALRARKYELTSAIISTLLVWMANSYWPLMWPLCLATFGATYAVVAYAEAGAIRLSRAMLAVRGVSWVIPWLAVLTQLLASLRERAADAEILARQGVRLAAEDQRLLDSAGRASVVIAVLWAFAMFSILSVVITGVINALRKRWHL